MGTLLNWGGWERKGFFTLFVGTLLQGFIKEGSLGPHFFQDYFLKPFLRGGEEKRGQFKGRRPFGKGGLGLGRFWLIWILLGRRERPF